jgi:hypothetical protein
MFCFYMKKKTNKKTMTFPAETASHLEVPHLVVTKPFRLEMSLFSLFLDILKVQCKSIKTYCKDLEFRVKPTVSFLILL